jgi:hypothetical protein
VSPIKGRAGSGIWIGANASIAQRVLWIWLRRRLGCESGRPVYISLGVIESGRQ